MSRRDKKSKAKRECCDKPLRKACKRCPRRLEAAAEPSGRPGGLPPCVAELLRR